MCIAKIAFRRQASAPHRNLRKRVSHIHGTRAGGVSPPWHNYYREHNGGRAPRTYTVGGSANNRLYLRKRVSHIHGGLTPEPLL
jgi:hypothetical protein